VVNHKTYVTLFVGLLLLSGCNRHRQSGFCANANARSEVPVLDIALAKSQADQAFDKGEKSLLAVESVGLEVPGLNGDPGNYRYGFKTIKGTSEIVCSDRDREANSNARNYAKAYNLEILSRQGDAVK
jgi:hypothetical protein